MSRIKEWGFNLLPKETFEKREKQRKYLDRVSVFSAVLPMLAVIVWIVFLLLGISTEAQIRQVESDTKKADTSIASFQFAKDRKALFVLKTRALEDVVTKDVNPENFFEVIQEAIQSSGISMNIKAYGRDQSGAFFIEANTSSVANISKITRVFRENPRMKGVKMTKVNSNLGASYDFEIVFDIVEPKSGT